MREPFQWETQKNVAASIAVPIHTDALELTHVPNRKSFCKRNVGPATTNAA
jgi:hypothetical protein